MAINDEEQRELLRKGAAELEIDLSEAQLKACLVYIAELKKWNRKMNLTGISDDRDVIIKHFLDSLSFKKGFAARDRMFLLDMGSGAGFPALPLRILLPGLMITLVESVQKKATFLRHMIRTLKLTGAEVWDKRLGELPESASQQYDIVTARAFASMEAAIGEGCRFLRRDGVMILSRGPEERIDERALDANEMTVSARFDMTLPLSDHRRALWVFRRKG